MAKRWMAVPCLALGLAVPRAVDAGVEPVVDCAAFVVVGEPQSPAGATWTYRSTDVDGTYALEGILFLPLTPAPYAGVVVSHGKGGTPYGYSASVARVMVGWGLAVIGTMSTHAPDAADAGNLPDGPDGASDANVARAYKARQLLWCVKGVDPDTVAAHGHSMGAFVTGQLLGRHPDTFRAASHTAGGVSPGPNATTSVAAKEIVTPYQLHHSAADTTVSVQQDLALAAILETSGIAHELFVEPYPGYTHAQTALDPAMFARVREWYRFYGVLR